MDTRTDDELVRLAAAGDERSTDELLERYRNYVKSRARSFFLAGSEPEDLVQEGMIGLYKAIRDYQPDRNSSFKSFARLCINRQIITAIKTANREKHKPLNNYVSLSRPGDGENGQDESFCVEMVDNTAGSNPEEAMLNKEMRETFHRQMAELLTAYEARVLSDYLRGMSYAEIAKENGITPKSVDNALQRIRRKLQNAIER